MNTNSELCKSLKNKSKGDGINLTVYINVVAEKDASPAQREAIAQVREIYAEWFADDAAPTKDETAEIITIHSN